MEYFDEMNGNDEGIVNETNTIKKDGFKLSSSNMCVRIIYCFFILLDFWMFKFLRKRMNKVMSQGSRTRHVSSNGKFSGDILMIIDVLKLFYVFEIN